MFGFLGKLFGGNQGEKAPATHPGTAVEYQGFTILPEPFERGGQWQLAARITKTVDGETREHHLIRADLIADPTEAQSSAVTKAKRMIDEQGDGIFR
ncbi:MAG: HlyU family transcriptional regulator [Pseudomonadota bacterium]